MPATLKTDPRRIALCNSLVKTVVIIRDGFDHTAAVNRACTADGCVGYRAVLLSYDQLADQFRIGWQKYIPSDQVDAVAIYDNVTSAIDALIDLRTFLLHEPLANCNLPPNRPGSYVEVGLAHCQGPLIQIDPSPY